MAPEHAGWLYGVVSAVETMPECVTITDCRLAGNPLVYVNQVREARRTPTGAHSQPLVFTRFILVGLSCINSCFFERFTQAGSSAVKPGVTGKFTADHKKLNLQFFRCLATI